MVLTMDTMLDEPTVRAEEIRSDGPDRPVSITASWSSQALSATATALSEQLARLRQTPAQDAEQVLLVRHHAELADRFAEHASAGANALLVFDDSELAVCARELGAYLLRIDDGSGYQPPELRDRLHTVRLVRTSLCQIVSEARAAAGDAAGREHTLPC
jgi:hypothetical protein